MNLYKGVWYPERKVEILDRGIVDILTNNESSCIDQGFYDKDFERQDTRPFAINYGSRRGDGSPVVRGFEFEGVLYEINVPNLSLIKQKILGQLFYDRDKIELKDQFVFEGEAEEFIQEFIKRGYKVK